MNIEITYRRTKRLSMRIVKNGDVHVSAPLGTPKETVMKFIEDNRDWIAKARKDTIDRQIQAAHFFDQLPLMTERDWKDATYRLAEIIRPLYLHYAKLMGVRPTGVTFKLMTSRWGRCNVRTGQIAFSVYLLLLPEWCIEHVVVHELAHLIEPNHGPHFHELMDQYFPRWREARKETRRIASSAVPDYEEDE